MLNIDDVKLGQKVRITGHATFNDYDGNSYSYRTVEKAYIDTKFTLKPGVVEFVDDSNTHPIMVFFGVDHIPVRTRFALNEIEAR